MVKTIAIIGTKGGASKTTVSIAIAGEWHRRGRRVLLVDSDVDQRSCLDWAQTAEETGQPTPTVVAMGAGLHKEDQLPSLAKDFDLVVIDCPGRSGKIQKQALAVADVAILPTAGSGLDTWSLTELIETIEEAQALRPHLEAYLLLSRHQAHTTTGKGVRAALADSGLPVLDAVLGFRVAYQDSITAGHTPTTWEPSGPAAKEVQSLCDELGAILEASEEANCATA